MERVWKDILNYEGYYQISNYGEVRSKCPQRKSKVIPAEWKEIILGNRGKYKYIVLHCYPRKPKKVSVHRLVYETFHNTVLGNMCLDHIDCNKYNNRLDNLRPATVQQNGYNCSKQRGDCTSKYKGVSWLKREKRWRANIKLRGKAIHLGTFTIEEDAAFAYNSFAKKVHGKFARLNVIEGANP